VVSGHQASVDSFDAGPITREMISASARSRARHGGPSRPGKPSWCAIAATAATCPCGSDPGDGELAAGRHQLRALQPRVDPVDHLPG
jgi:hypothetical protein